MEEMKPEQHQHTEGILRSGIPLQGEPAQEPDDCLSCPVNSEAEEVGNNRRNSMERALEVNGSSSFYSLYAEEKQSRVNIREAVIRSGERSETEKNRDGGASVDCQVVTQDQCEGSAEQSRSREEVPIPCAELNSASAAAQPLDSGDKKAANISTEGFPFDISLRQWLSKSERVVDRVENLHIFKQILEFVDLAHSQGVVLRNVRPSCFLLSSLHRVSFIDSSKTNTSSGSSEQSTGRAAVPASVPLSFRDDGSRVQSNVPSEVEHAAIEQQVDPRTRGTFSIQEEALQSGFERGDQSHHTTTPLQREDQTEPCLQPGENSGVSRQDLNLASRPNLCNDQGSADSPTFEDMIKSISSGERSGSSEESSRRVACDGMGERSSEARNTCFPLKQTLLLEQTWYTSPEELNGSAPSFASDIHNLGVLFFELFSSFGSEMERSRTMSDLRHRVLPPRLLLEHQKEAALCLRLLHPDPNSRPKAREVLLGDLLSEVGDELAERQAAINLEDREAELELTLKFLLQIEQQKKEVIRMVSVDFECIMSDIEEVERWRSLLKQSGKKGGKKNFMDIQNIHTYGGSNVDEHTKNVLGKRFYGHESHIEISDRENGQGRQHEALQSKTVRLLNNFDKFKQVYFDRWLQVKQPKQKSVKVDSGYGGRMQGIRGLKVGISRTVTDLNGQKVEAGVNPQDRWLGCFFDSFCKFLRYNRFEVKATLQHGDLLNTANMVSSLSFDRDEQFFATAGVCKRIKVFEIDELLNEAVNIHYPVAEMLSRSKLSSICWNGYIKSHIASSDYQGVVQIWDVNTSQTLMEFKEHERRAWSVDFSRGDPTKLASGSDDCNVKIWSINQAASIGTIKTKANICCVQFPHDSSHLLAFGSADSKIYIYDLRNTRKSLRLLTGHGKSVSFVRFVDSATLVSASTDSTLKLWDLAKASTSGGAKDPCAMTFTGHTNEKSFVGLSVANGGYIVCGSETNEVFAYHKSFPMPIMSHKFGCTDPISGQEIEDDNGQFVSSVCWRGKSESLVAANSVGNIKVLEMV